MRVVVIVSLVLVLVGGSRGASNGEVADRAGCVGVLSDHGVSDAGSVLAVSARECRSVDGELLTAGAAADRFAAAVWTSAWPRFDAVHVTVYRSAESPDRLRGGTQVYPRDVLEERWGPREAGLDRATPGVGPVVVLWLLLPVAAVAVLGAVVGFAVRAARSGVVGFVWIPR